MPLRCSGAKPSRSDCRRHSHLGRPVGRSARRQRQRRALALLKHLPLLGAQQAVATDAPPIALGDGLQFRLMVFGTYWAK